MDQPRPRNELKDIEKELVAEQPGLALGVTGLCLALFFGLGLRFLCQSDRYLELVESAAKQIDPRVQAKVGTAYISLADGILPELAVVVKEISVESSESCWMRPSIEVDEIKLPVDFWQLLHGKLFVHEISAGDVSVSLRSDLSQCPSAKTAQVSDQPVQHLDSAEAGPSRFVAAISPPGTAVSATSMSVWNRVKNSNNQIDHLDIHRLRLHYLPILFTSVEVRRFSVDVVNQNPRLIKASGYVSLAGETLSGDYASTASMSLEFSEKTEPLWALSLDGNWREGHYQLDAAYKPRLQGLKMDFDMSQIPLNQLLPLLRKYKIITADLNGRQNWLSISGHMDGLRKGDNLPPLILSRLKLEGAIGEIEGKDIAIQNPLPPFDLEVRSLQIESLLQFLGETRRHPIFGKLGVFHGKYHYQDNENSRLKGELSGLEFIFSSRGLRQPQVMSLISADATISPKKLNVHLDQMRPAEGLFLGDVLVNSDLNFTHVQAKVRVDELTLSPSVQRVMTNGGVIGSLTGEVVTSLENGAFKDLRGSLGISELTVEKLSVKKGKAHFSTQSDTVTVTLRAQNLSVQEGSEPYRFLNLLLEPNGPSGYEFASGAAVIKTHQLKDLQWSELYLQNPSESVRSEGGWNPSGELSGEISSHSKISKGNFKLTGTRDKPQVLKQ
jgi:hypothetical protein